MALIQTLDLLLLLLELLLHASHFRNRTLDVVLPEDLVLRQGLVRKGTRALLLDPLQDRSVLEQVTVHCRSRLLDHLLSDGASEGLDLNLLSCGRLLLAGVALVFGFFV